LKYVASCVSDQLLRSGKSLTTIGATLTSRENDRLSGNGWGMAKTCGRLGTNRYFFSHHKIFIVCCYTKRGWHQMKLINSSAKVLAVMKVAPCRKNPINPQAIADLQG